MRAPNPDGLLIQSCVSTQKIEDEEGVVLCDFEVAMSTGSFRMDNTLGDALSVEMRILLEQVKVFKQGIPALSDCQTAIRIKEYHRVNNQAHTSYNITCFL